MGSTGRVPGLLIFDCDGVLVDSEMISAEVLAEELTACGLPINSSYVFSRFLGRSMDAVRSILRDEFDHPLSQASLNRVRKRMRQRLMNELKPVPGVVAALGALRELPKCVASSSRPERIRMSLDVTHLREQFGKHIYSATMVEAGKPAPDLFLHAATSMGVPPDLCVVIEDSPAGVEAAQRAGMRVMAFTGGAHATAANLRPALAALAPDAIFHDMLRLPKLLLEEQVSH